ncbi:MAG: glycosyltransferase family 2 protein [Gammaproteobacteria bacterium]|nr:glycosyltransferase family 2 protein [Gammaproteobacteria bacterium]MDG1952845.1 glycosyltransferase family 2 protein [Gammaproteobacteria bacterium]MDG2118769.1 glycosyltransferase family 2 protein [Gammaproteobacteria bacterium]
MSDEILASVYIITLNEEENIQALLDNVKNFNEVILVDSGSTDNTLTLAAQYNNVFIHEQAWLGFSAQKSFALNLCKNEWVLNLDADEICTKEFVDEATNLIKENSHDALESTRLLLRFGEKVRHFGGEDRLIRFFRKSCGHYQTRRVHESISITGRVKSTSASILHFENLTLSRRFEKANRYSELKAEDKLEKGDTTSGIVIMAIFPISFIQFFIIKGHFLGGIDGFITAMNAAFYNFMKYSKLRELKKIKNL